MAVLNPLPLTITNRERPEVLAVANHPGDEAMGTRSVHFTSELYIDAADFREEANKKYKRLVIGKRVRLRGGYVIEADRCDHDSAGEVSHVYAHVVEGTLGEDPPDGIKAKGVIHWVSATEGLSAEIRCYDRLFTDPNPGKAEDMMALLNPKSLVRLEHAVIEPSAALAAKEGAYQFEREGYFVADRYDHTPEKPVFNMTIGLRDTWSDSHG